ncbi:MAG TPA: hypothetical protein VLC08_05740 [Chitinolyticbacter sp.]|nr:hypothetical protein [Chitinolyticbacter sp.]
MAPEIRRRRRYGTCCQWREQQIRQLDDDYDRWSQERYGKFSSEFEEWRNKQRASQAGPSGQSGPLETGAPASGSLSGKEAGSSGRSATGNSNQPGKGETGSNGSSGEQDESAKSRRKGM